ncbi:MAG: NADH dehydrogenase [Ignavibacteriaceae bacterium]|nr:MAG: 4Fe-4S dicluster domain-containing protein [Chlorobiota bacterium]GJQ31861.1 MAG: NADH dehydrogenase [Ignavibacteriaceae bacterium]
MNSMPDLKNIAAEFSELYSQVNRRVIICAGTGCMANGAQKIKNEFLHIANLTGLKFETDLRKEEERFDLLTGSGCQGFCQMGPLVTVEPEGIFYIKVKPEDVAEIVAETVMHGRPVERLLYKASSGKPCHTASDINFYKKQTRRVLKDCGNINPEDIREYIHRGGYSAAEKALKEMSPVDVCDEILNSGLRGRGGGGFPTGRKWALAQSQKSDKKYIICNGDEGDPGAFMDRSVMEGNPHSVIEGMLIAAHAIGADEGYVYVRLEYPLAVKRIKKAVEVALEYGILGDNIFGTGKSFRVNVMEGAGAFVCGEETALISSIEGKRGMPNPKPPFPAQSGLFGKPTIINNVETLAMVPGIIRNGAAEFRQTGTKDSPGTKTFALTGHVVNTGLIEVPFGTTLREIIFDIGGGVIGNDGEIDPEGFKAVQIGGPSGGCLTEAHLDLPLSFDSLRSIGAMVGSGGLVVMNRSTCMVRIAKYFMEFTQNESCGKCVPCREGTRQMLSLLEDITEGKADEHTLEILDQLGKAITKASLCGLGKTAPNPVLSLLTLFREEMEIHVTQQRCPAKECKALLTPVVIEEKCKGCGLCIKKCPVGAISGEKKQPHFINEELCIKCGACIEACRLDAISEGV